jgi:hypothetical protein
MKRNRRLTLGSLDSAIQNQKITRRFKLCSIGELPRPKGAGLLEGQQMVVHKASFRASKYSEQHSDLYPYGGRRPHNDRFDQLTKVQTICEQTVIWKASCVEPCEEVNVDEVFEVIVHPNCKATLDWAGTKPYIKAKKDETNMSATHDDQLAIIADALITIGQSLKNLSKNKGSLKAKIDKPITILEEDEAEDDYNDRHNRHNRGCH